MLFWITLSAYVTALCMLVFLIAMIKDAIENNDYLTVSFSFVILIVIIIILAIFPFGPAIP